MKTPAAYHRLSVAEKHAHNTARVREPAVTCPSCDMQVMPVDLLAHIKERCPGPREPGPGAKWVSWREAIAQGVPKGTLAAWVKHGFVRVRGARQDREYLLRDLALKIAQRLGFRRR